MSSALFRSYRVLWMPFELAWAPPQADSALCCESMRAALAFDCAQHADAFECADSIMVYNPVFDEYGIPVHDGGSTYVRVTHCPWCGTTLPSSQRDRWFDETEALGLGDGDPLPQKYLSAAWRS